MYNVCALSNKRKSKHRSTTMKKDTIQKRNRKNNIAGGKVLVNNISQDDASSKDLKYNNVGCEHPSQTNTCDIQDHGSSSHIKLKNILQKPFLQSKKNFEQFNPIFDNKLVNDISHNGAGNEELKNIPQEDAVNKECLKFSAECEQTFQDNTFHLPNPGLSSVINGKNNFKNSFQQSKFKKKISGERRTKICSNSNCATKVASAWRRVNGELVCNACGLYYKINSKHRPTTMKKDTIQKRNRKKNGAGSVELGKDIPQDEAGNEELLKFNVGCEHPSQANTFDRPDHGSSSHINVENNLQKPFLQSVNDIPHNDADNEVLKNDIPQDNADNEELKNDIPQDNADNEKCQKYSAECEPAFQDNTFHLPNPGLSSLINVENNFKNSFLQSKFTKKISECDRSSKICSNSNCATKVASKWRRVEGEIMCNACALYYMRKSKHRPTTMKKDTIQKRNRKRKNDGTCSEKFLKNNVGSKHSSQANTFDIPDPESTSPINGENNLKDPFLQSNFTKKISGERRTKICSNSNCATKVARAWRKVNGEIMCKACALYYKRKSYHRPTTMIKETIQKINRKHNGAGSEEVVKDIPQDDACSEELLKNNVGYEDPSQANTLDIPDHGSSSHINVENNLQEPFLQSIESIDCYPLNPISDNTLVNDIPQDGACSEE